MKAKLRIVSRADGDSINLDRLARIRPHELQQLYRKMFGADLSSWNSEQARRRIAWQIQADRKVVFLNPLASMHWKSQERQACGFAHALERGGGPMAFLCRTRQSPESCLITILGCRCQGA